MSAAAAPAPAWERWVIVAYVAWAVACIAIVLAKDGLSPDNVTRLGIGA